MKRARFYRDIMKFPVKTDLKHWVSFRVGAALLTLRPRTVWTVCDDGKSIPGSAAVQLAFRVPPPAVDACHAELVARGVPILRAPTDLPDWRHRTLFFRDPEDTSSKSTRSIERDLRSVLRGATYSAVVARLDRATQYSKDGCD